MLKVFNTLSRKKEAFKPLHGNSVGMYTCGPSVYQLPHIGNYRTYAFEDSFKRYLEWKGFRVRHVMNVTDVENKAVAEARRLGVPLKKLTASCAREFFSGLKKLNALPPDATPRATDFITDISRFVEELSQKGFAYERGGDWYFDVSRFPRYGMLSRLRRRPPKGRRVSFDDYYKWQAGDFILWRRCRKRDGGNCWNTPLGRGRPGWSIECSAIARRFLGERFDVKMGGVDNIFAHHENEIAQSFGVSGKLFAKYFIHCKHLLINGRKMSKSLGNVVTLEDAEKKGVEPPALRMLYLQTHYRRRLDFTWRKAARAQKRLNECRRCVAELKKACVRGGGASPAAGRQAGKAREAFEAAMDDDLHTEKALAAACGLVDWALAKTKKGALSGTDAKQVLGALEDFDRVLGLGML
jgi:cysteinyl-tRNA synthetase